LVNEGLLEKPIKKARVKLYQSTPIGKRIKVNQVKGKNIKFLPLVGSIAKNEVKIRHHRLGFKIKVLSPIRRKIHWDGTNKKLNGIEQYFLYWPSEKPPRTTIRYQPSKKKGKYGEIVVWPPEKKLSFEEWKYWQEYLDKYIEQIYGWLMKIFQCELGLPQHYQKSEFGIPPYNKLQKLACKLNLRYGDCWTDKSYYGEFESNNPEKAEAMRILIWGNELIPQKVDRQQKKIYSLEKTFIRYLENDDKRRKSDKKIKESIEELRKFNEEQRNFNSEQKIFNARIFRFYIDINKNIFKSTENNNVFKRIKWGAM